MNDKRFDDWAKMVGWECLRWALLGLVFWCCHLASTRQDIGRVPDNACIDFVVNVISKTVRLLKELYKHSRPCRIYVNTLKCSILLLFALIALQAVLIILPIPSTCDTQSIKLAEPCSLFDFAASAINVPAAFLRAQVKLPYYFLTYAFDLLVCLCTEILFPCFSALGAFTKEIWDWIAFPLLAQAYGAFMRAEPIGGPLAQAHGAFMRAEPIGGPLAQALPQFYQSLLCILMVWMLWTYSIKTLIFNAVTGFQGVFFGTLHVASFSINAAATACATAWTILLRI